eukprot:scaffold1450_cov170-Amphora_coffeaeformis.AAC.9
MAAGVGIDLQRANVAFMMDPWWNEAIENQASTLWIEFIGWVRLDPVVCTCIISIVQKGKAMLGKGTRIKLTKEEEKSAKITTLKASFFFVFRKLDTTRTDTAFLPLFRAKRICSRSKKAT